MAEKVDLQFGGLATSVNPFSSAPEVSASVMDNCVLRNPNLIEPRRGYSATSANASGNIARVFPWKSRLLTVTTGGVIKDYAASTWSSAYTQAAIIDASDTPTTCYPAWTTFSPPDASNPIRTATASKSLFFTSNGGVKVIDGVARAVFDAGLAAPHIRDVSLDNSGTTWLLGGNTVAYRAVIGKYDANNNLILSAPSNSFSITNPGGGATQRTRLLVWLPANSGGATFLQVYRTLQTDSDSPGDEMFLVYELSLDPSNPVLHEKDLYDQTDDGGGVGSVFLGEPLYTNPVTGNGIDSANDLPPLARSLCAYNNVLLYANTTERHIQELQLFGVQDLVAATSTFIVAGTTFPSGASENLSTNPPTWGIYTGGTPAENVDQTARSLCNAINKHAYSHNLSVEAFYTSTPDTMPGRFYIQEKGVGGSAFTVAVGHSGENVWSPDLSSTSTILTSDNIRRPNRLYWSKLGIPWAVPGDNWVDIGDADKAILRVVLVRSTVFIFKEDGVWTLSGAAAPFTIEPFDPGLVLLAPESCCVVGNQLFCLTNRGYVYINESGVSSAMSRPIARDVDTLLATCTSYPTIAFGVPYESEGLAFLAMPTAQGDSTATQQYVFNSTNPSWSRFTIASLLGGAAHGCLDPATGGLVWAVGATLWQERKSFTSADCSDPIFTLTNAVGTTSSSTLVLSSTDATKFIRAGDVIVQGGTTCRVYSVAILFVPGPGAHTQYTCTLDGAYSFTATDVEIRRAYTCQWRIFPWAGGDPTSEKVFEPVYLVFRKANFEYFTVGFDSDVSQTFSSTTLVGPLTAGDLFWLARFDVPQNATQGTVLGLDITIQQAQSFWQLEAVRFTYTPSTLSSRRGT